MAHQPQPAHSPVSTADQIQSLINRGMAVPDADFAARCLTHIGDYRLRSYWFPFQASRARIASFRPGASFNQVMTLYMFDQRLRSLLLEALSYVEISVRNQWSRHVAQSSSKGEFAHLDASLFDPKYYAGNLQELERNYNQVRGHGSTGFQSVGLWDILPTMSFGNLSKWFSSVADQKVKQSISSNYGVDEVILENALRNLTSVRNSCAHHERVWNRNVERGLKIPQRLDGSGDVARAFNKSCDRKIYNTLVIIIYLLDIIIPSGDWPERLLALLAENSSLPYRSMGFPTGWREFPVWQRHMPQENGSG